MVGLVSQPITLYFIGFPTGSTLEGAVLEVTLAKPVDKDTLIRSPKASRPIAVPTIGFMAVDYNSLVPAIYPTYYSPPK